MISTLLVALRRRSRIAPHVGRPSEGAIARSSDSRGPASASPSSRRRTAIELAVLAALTGLYLGLWPHRPPGVDPGLAIVGVCLVALSRRRISERVWGQPASPTAERLRRGTIVMTQFTVPVLLAFGLFGGWDAYSAHHDWQDVLRRLLTPRLFLTLVVYVPWALIQQTLFQFYLLGRLRVLVPSASPFGLASLNGLLYGAVHFPEWDVALITMAGGLVWSYAYQRHRSILPIALSHAALGTTYFSWVRRSHAVRILGLALGMEGGSS